MDGLSVIIIAIAGILGLVIGSFLNVVIYRVPRGQSIVSPPSACPRCGARIAPRDNVPVVSWLLLRARCRHCQEPISPRYPIVEAVTGLMFAGVAARFRVAVDAPTGILVGSVLVIVLFLYFAAVSVALAAIDIDTHRLPNAIVLPSYAVTVLLIVAASISANDYSLLLPAAIGGAALFAAYLLMALVYPGGMGFGDVKLAGLIGLLLGFMGWGELLVGAFSAFLLGGLFGIALLLSRRAKRRSGIPFGPWMLAGAWVGIFFGDRIWNGYLGLFGLA
jgi:leader peptidase (prepilin peptidase)/N-methyltransferase